MVTEITPTSSEGGRRPTVARHRPRPLLAPGYGRFVADRPPRREGDDRYHVCQPLFGPSHPERMLQRQRLLLNRAYYLLKPNIPWGVRMTVRRWFAKYQQRACADVWPIEEKAGTTPLGWSGGLQANASH